MNDTTTVNPNEPKLDKKVEVANVELVKMKNQLIRLEINESIFQRHTLTMPSDSQIKTNLAQTQAQMKLVKGAIEVLEDIIKDETK